TFGDEEQIRTLKQLDKKFERELEIEKARKAGTLKKFRVHFNIVEVTPDDEIIEALDMQNAETIFFEKHRDNENEMEITSIKEI
ncbi:MAG: hypothetical protein Q8K02_18845, partial [Flavobacterium sp.]|nr:hypothetical protein [Flavobacterium sp.]